MMNMAIVLQQQGKHAEALALYERALSGLRSSLGDAHPDTLMCMFNIAVVWHNQGCHAEALERFQIVLAGRVQCLGDDHPLTLTCRRAVAAARQALKRKASSCTIS
jgi:tetratricopeptide (TPR) repeat protein